MSNGATADRFSFDQIFGNQFNCLRMRFVIQDMFCLVQEPLKDPIELFLISDTLLQNPFDLASLARPLVCNTAL